MLLFLRQPYLWAAPLSIGHTRGAGQRGQSVPVAPLVDGQADEALLGRTFVELADTLSPVQDTTRRPPSAV